MAESPEVTGSYYAWIVIYILTWDLTLTAHHRHDHHHQYLVYSLLAPFCPVVCECDWGHYCGYNTSSYHLVTPQGKPHTLLGSRLSLGMLTPHCHRLSDWTIAVLQDPHVVDANSLKTQRWDKMGLYLHCQNSKVPPIRLQYLDEYRPMRVDHSAYDVG